MANTVCVTKMGTSNDSAHIHNSVGGGGSIRVTEEGRFSVKCNQTVADRVGHRKKCQENVLLGFWG